MSLSRSITLTPGEGLPGRVWLSGEAAWVPDVQDDASFPRASVARQAGLRAGFCFPLRSARGVLGVIELFTGEARELDAELLATMAMLGDQIGQAIERRRDAERLSAARSRHQAMLDAALESVITIDDDGRVVEFNPAAERTFGYTAADVIGRDMAELIIPPELRERHRAGFARFSRDGRADDPRHAHGAHGHARGRLDLPGRGHDHADRRARRGGLRRLPARHHRSQGGRGGAARVASADRRGRRRRPPPARARPARRRAAAARGAGAAAPHGARADRHRSDARRRSSWTPRWTRSPTRPPSSASWLAASIPWSLTEGGLRPALADARGALEHPGRADGGSGRALRRARSRRPRTSPWPRRSRTRRATPRRARWRSRDQRGRHAPCRGERRRPRRRRPARRGARRHRRPGGRASTAG